MKTITLVITYTANVSESEFIDTGYIAAQVKTVSVRQVFPRPGTVKTESMIDFDLKSI